MDKCINISELMKAIFDPERAQGVDEKVARQASEIGDSTEIERLQARKTAYVGTRKDGKSQGFWAMVLATPYRGRAIPCGVITYSSKTIATQQDSRKWRKC